MSELPSRNVTFLFTDIEGSTKLWQEHPQKMFPALTRHNDLLHHAIETCGGVVFKTVGDAFCAVFDSASDALQAAFKAQTALAAEIWGDLPTLRVRMGLHTGDAIEIKNDFFGLTLSVVARLLSTGHGAQTLLTQSTFERVQDSLPPDVNLRSMGLHRLKDIYQFETVYQLLHPRLPADFPPLKSLDARQTNITLPADAFIGREKETAALLHLLDSERLTTITGIGGAGKTRLAQHVGETVLKQYRDGVWFVDLAQVTDPELVPAAVAEVMAVREQPGRLLLDTLANDLRDKSLLLLLDNCEHLVLACAQLVQKLLGIAPNLKILATSRASLGIRGEKVWAVPSLGLPEKEQTLPAESALEADAVRLFVERAQAVNASFVPTAEEAQIILEICRQLDGIPLAIELAAARKKSLSVHQIHTQLENRLRLLTGGKKDSARRQQSMELAIDWSYNLLDDNEKRLWHELSIFAGSCSLAAVQAICAADDRDEWAVLEILERLLDQSLVAVDERGEMRYRLLETLRQYARKKLHAAAQEQPVRDRHLAYFLTLAEASAPKLCGREQGTALACMEEEFDNFRAALEWSLGGTNSPETEDGASIQIGARLVYSLWGCWYELGNFSEGRKWLTTALNHADALPQELKAKLLHAAGTLAMEQGDYTTAQKLLEQALALKKEVSRSVELARSLVSYGATCFRRRDVAQAKDYFDEAFSLLPDSSISDNDYAAQDINAIRANVEHWLGNIAYVISNYDAASEHYHNALQIHEQLQNWARVADVLSNMGSIFHIQGNYEKARSCYERSVHLSRQMHTKIALGNALNNLGNLARQCENFTAAQEYLKECLVLYRRLGSTSGIANAQCNLAAVALFSGALDEAFLHLKESLCCYRDVNDNAGMATVLEGFACWGSTSPEKAAQSAQLLGIAEMLWQKTPASHRDSVDFPIYERAVEQLRDGLGELILEAEQQKGKKMSLNQAFVIITEWNL